MTRAKTPAPNGRKRRVSPPRINLIEHAGEIERIFHRAVQHELSIHKHLGNPIAVLTNGKVVIVPPEQINVDGAI